MDDYLSEISIGDFISQLALEENSRIFMSIKDLDGNTIKTFKMFGDMFGGVSPEGKHDSELSPGVAQCARAFSKQDQFVWKHGKPIQYTNLLDYPTKTTLIEGMKFPIRDPDTRKIVAIGVFGMEVSTKNMSTILFNCLYGDSLPRHKEGSRVLNISGLTEEKKKKVQELLFWHKKGLKRRAIAERMNVSEEYVKKIFIAAQKGYNCKTMGELRHCLETGEIYVDVPDGLTIFSGVNISLSEDLFD